jgi:hypothetical protein
MREYSEGMENLYSLLCNLCSLISSSGLNREAMTKLHSND